MFGIKLSAGGQGLKEREFSDEGIRADRWVTSFAAAHLLLLLLVQILYTIAWCLS